MKRKIRSRRGPSYRLIHGPLKSTSRRRKIVQKAIQTTALASALGAAGVSLVPVQKILANDPKVLEAKTESKSAFVTLSGEFKKSLQSNINDVVRFEQKSGALTQSDSEPLLSYSSLQAPIPITV